MQYTTTPGATFDTPDGGAVRLVHADSPNQLQSAQWRSSYRTVGRSLGQLACFERGLGVYTRLSMLVLVEILSTHEVFVPTADLFYVC